MAKRKRKNSIHHLSDIDSPIKRKCQTPRNIEMAQIENMTKNSLKFVQWNCNGIRNKDLFLKQFLFVNKPDVIGILQFKLKKHRELISNNIF